MAKTITPDQFGAAIQKILSQYEGSVQDHLEEATRKVAKAGAKAVQGAARAKIGGTGKYAASWTSQVEVGRLSTEGVIYSKKPSLPHLLEHGHAKRNGGRTAPREHIAPVEKEVVEEFESEVISGI